MTCVNEKEIQEACSILFGDNFSFERETIEYIQLSGIKHAFRSKVKEYHPDTAKDKQKATDSENFIRLKDAYDFLISVKSSKAVKIETNVSSMKNYNRNYNRTDEPIKTLPNRKLKIGEYLYYSGKITWEELIAAMTWQRQNRKKTNTNYLFGNYFTRFNILDPAEMGFAVFKLNIHNSRFNKQD